MCHSKTARCWTRPGSRRPCRRSASSPVLPEDPAAIRGKRVLVVEDGPTLTHGEMAFGAAHVAAIRGGAAVIVKDVLPAMGYGEAQRADLERTINASDCELVLIGTPIDLGRLLKLDKPAMRVRYELDETATATLREEVERVLTSG